MHFHEFLLQLANPAWALSEDHLQKTTQMAKEQSQMDLSPWHVGVAVREAYRQEEFSHCQRRKGART